MKCFDYQAGTDTSGKPVMKRHCECGTTACQQTSVGQYKLTKLCKHDWYKCEPETDDIEHCICCGAHRNPKDD